MTVCPCCKQDIDYTIKESKYDKGKFFFKCDNPDCIVEDIIIILS